MHVDRRLLGWGLFFILVGGIPLATNAGLLDRQTVGQWPLLWPVLLIAWGGGLLLRGTPIEWLGGALAAITFGVMGGGALSAGLGGIPIASGCGGGNTTATAFAGQSGQLGTTARAEFEFNCGTFNVTTADGSGWSITGSDHAGQGPVITAGQSSLSARSTNRGPFDTIGRATWNVSLPRTPVLALAMTLNAGEGNFNLSGAALSSVSMTLNAGDTTLSLGSTSQLGDVSATVNAGSATVSLPAGDHAVNMSLNAGSLKVCAPVGAPIRVQWSGALGSNNFDANGLVKLDQNTWTSAGFSDGQPHLELHVSANAGSFELQFGGSCGA